MESVFDESLWDVEEFVVKLNWIVDYFISLLLSLKFFDLYLLFFQFFVIFKESMHLIEHMLRQIANVFIMGHGHVILSDWDDLIILLSLVNHAHNPYHFSLYEAKRFHTNTTQYQNIEWVLIIAVGLWNKTIVGGIVHSTEKDTI